MYAPMNNPFQQPHHLWKGSLSLPYQWVELFSELFEEHVLSLTYFEQQASDNMESRPEDIWEINFYISDLNEIPLLQSKAKNLASLHQLTLTEIQFEEVNDCDWVSRVQNQFTPFKVGQFFIATPHFNPPNTLGMHSIMMEAGRAFGTGEHETTYGCLHALSQLKAHFHLQNMLDMGCGSGILAIAMAKLWRHPVLAVDIDAVSVQTCQRNVQLNKVHPLVTSIQSPGFRSRKILQKAPYQLITANILANPLISMAKDIKNHLAPRGLVVLSGFLNYQVNRIHHAYSSQGFVLYKRYQFNKWNILVYRLPF